jgi:hypothetical protein
MKTLLDDFGFERDIAENGNSGWKCKLILTMYFDGSSNAWNEFEATEYIRTTMNSKIWLLH